MPTDSEVEKGAEEAKNLAAAVLAVLNTADHPASVMVAMEIVCASVCKYFDVPPQQLCDRVVSYLEAADAEQKLVGKA